MDARAGDRIIVESERVGQHDRAGEILEVTDSPFGRNFRVRWDDGHTTEFRPKSGSARIEAAKTAPSGG